MENALIRMLITIFLGCFGVHKFLEGENKMGFIYLFTCGLFGFGWIFDSISAVISYLKYKNEPPAYSSNNSPVFDLQKNILVNTNHTMSNFAVLNKEESAFPNWHVSISFGKSTSDSYNKAVELAKSAPQYYEQIDNGRIIHQAIFSSNPQEYLAFIQLYELVDNWKSSSVMINEELIDRKIIRKLNYCYGDRCRSCNPTFCHGASYMTANPFGCHRIQISACNNPWWTFFIQIGNKWYLDKDLIKQRIDETANTYYICPIFNYNNILRELDNLPNVLDDSQMQQLQRAGYSLRI